jgi:peroxiredoxin Q/BCP
LLAFQKDSGKFERLNAQVLGVSFDDMETHQKFMEEFSITFPLISDEDSAIRNLYAPGRIAYLIDTKGIIRHIQKGVPVNEDFLRELEKLQ